MEDRTMDEEMILNEEEQEQAKYLLIEALQEFKRLADMKYQPILTDLNGIRSGAGKGETAYQKPFYGIPLSDMMDASDIEQAIQFVKSYPQTSAAIYRDINACYHLPATGIPYSDLAATVQAILDKCSALTPATSAEIAQIWSD